MGMKPITHHLTEKQIERLRAESERSGLTVAELIRRSVDSWLDRAGEPMSNRKDLQPAIGEINERLTALSHEQKRLRQLRVLMVSEQQESERKDGR